jgi:hypothetical protein
MPAGCAGGQKIVIYGERDFSGEFLSFGIRKHLAFPGLQWIKQAAGFSA